MREIAIQVSAICGLIQIPLYFKNRREITRLRRAIKAFGLQDQINEYLYLKGERKQK